MPERGQPHPNSLRLFIAIELPDDVRNTLTATIARLQAAGIRDAVRWVRPESLHVTLKFLGSTDEEDLPAIITTIASVTKSMPPFDLRLDSLGAIHGRKRDPYNFRFTRESYPHNIRVLFASLAGEVDALKDLASRIDAACATLGFSTEKSLFLPHITIARVREKSDRAQREAISAILRATVPAYGSADTFWSAADVTDISVRQVSLMESTLQQGGAVYRALHTAPLQGSG